MSYNSDEIRGVLIRIGDENLLLPNATIAEVMPRMPVEILHGMPDWLPGRIVWHGWKVPLVVFSKFSGLRDDSDPSSQKIVVLKAQSGDEELPYFALPTPSFPHLISIPRDGLLADASEETLPHGVHMRILLGNHSALLPDLDMIERTLREALAAAEKEQLDALKGAQ